MMRRIAWCGLATLLVIGHGCDEDKSSNDATSTNDTLAETSEEVGSDTDAPDTIFDTTADTPPLPDNGPDVTPEDTLEVDTSPADTASEVDDTSTDTTPADTSPETVADTAPGDLEDDGETSQPLPAAAARVGPAGAHIVGADFSVLVPIGALTTTVDLRVYNEHDAPDGLGLLAPGLRFEPAGLRFLQPITVRVTLDGDALEDAEEVQAFWSLPDDTSRLQRVPHALAELTLEVQGWHFSYMFVVGWHVPNGSGWGCCVPINPIFTSQAECVSNPYNGVACDPDLCAFTPGPCAPPPPPPPPPGPPPTCAECLAALAVAPPEFTAAYQATQQALANIACDDLLAVIPPVPPDPTLLDAKLGSWCGWATSAGVSCPGIAPNPGCAATSHPTDLCPLCNEPLITQDSAYQAAFSAQGFALANSSCSAMLAMTPPAPSGVPGDPGFTAELGSFCGHWSYAAIYCPAATVSECQWASALQPSCNDCAGGVAGGDAAFSTSFDAAFSAAAASPCQTLMSDGPPPDPDVLGGAFMSELGAWCGWKNGLGLACASSPIPVEACQSPVGTGPLCDICATADLIADAEFSFAYNQTYAAFTQGTCADMISAGPYPAPQPPIASIGVLGEWCGYWNAAEHLCVAGTVGQCAFGALLPPECDTCEAGLAGADPSFIGAYQQALSNAGGIPCLGLYQLAPAVPDPNLPNLAGQTGSYCGWLAAVGAVCEPDPNEPPKEPAGCETGPWSPGCATCQAAIASHHPDFTTSFDLAVQGGSAASCDQLMQSPPLEPSANDPTFHFALGKWCAWKVNVAANCTDPAHSAQGCALTLP